MRYNPTPITGLALAVLLAAATVTASPLETRASEIPSDFPVFTVPGHTESMAALRDLYWQHYDITPKATLWDEWLFPPAIWPATRSDEAAASARHAFSQRGIDSEGYVFTNQHQSIAHQTGWPFPSWNQSSTGFGWHFSFDKTIGEGWRPNWLAKPEEWITTGTEGLSLEKEGWILKLAPGAVIAPPAFKGRAFESPYLQLRWRADDFDKKATPFIEWTTDTNPSFSPDRRFYFAPPESGKINYTMVPMYRHPAWQGGITGLRIGFSNPSETTVTIQALFAQYDTRHNVNNPSYVSACIEYFLWTGDLNFLRDNIEKIRLAMRYMETEFGTDTDGIVTMPWIGHEGRTGVTHNADGSKTLHNGEGVGNNYWDLLPFGQKDSYATIRHYGAALKMAELEKSIATHPGWNIPNSPLRRDTDHWTSQAAAAKENGNRLFWNNQTGRFTLGPDSNGKQADYGSTFLNLEAIYYDFATPDHARQIMQWINGDRAVSTDTARTTDIYHWRFAPRATTRRNIDHYMWVWNDAASIPFGGQVQDGGAVLGFSFHDLMARLRVLGPDNAAGRLEAITRWYTEVVNEGGYRAYYDSKKREGSLQGGGTAGGLGLDKEFFESVMVPQVMLEGFLGFQPVAHGFTLRPSLPKSWPSLTINNIRYRDWLITISASHKEIKITLKSITTGQTHESTLPRNGGFVPCSE